jgi:hypothetical protein
VEADIAFAMSSIVAAVAEMLGLTTGQVNAAVLIRRVWTYAPNIQGPDTGSGRVVTVDIMPYPPRASADGVRRVEEVASIAVALSSADSAHAAGAAYGFGGDFAKAAEGSSLTVM